MATLTATQASSGVAARAGITGVDQVTVQYNSGATAISPSATTVFLAKIPHGATILDVIATVSAGSATCPMDVGIDADLSAFITGMTIGTLARATKGVPYTVSVSDAAVTRYGILKATVTPGTLTASVIANVTVLYTMDP